MTKPSYELWLTEQKTPMPEARRHDRSTDRLMMTGFWRMQGPKTKPDWPVAIWTDVEKDGSAKAATIFQIGRKIQNTEEHSTEWDEFTQYGWLKCVAVTEADWHRAQGTGFWPSDNKPARKMTDEEKLGVETDVGGNNPPADESLADQISNLAEILANSKEPSSKDEATVLAGRLDKMRLLLKKADDERVREKEPHLLASREVDAKWKSIGEPGGNAYREATERQKAWLRKEQARLDAEAAAERKRLKEAAEAENERIRKENEARIAAQAEAGIPDEPADLLPEVTAPVVEAPRAVASSAFGRNSGLKKVKIAVIDDLAKLAAHFVETKDAEFIDYCQKRAAAALRGKVTLPGTSSREELQ